MQKITFLLILFLLVLANTSLAKDTTSLVERKRFPYKQQILPISLITAGALSLVFAEQINKPIYQKLPYSKYLTGDYLQYMPMVSMYIADLAGVNAKNSVWNQTKFLAMSQLLCAAIVQTGKYTIKSQRPNNGSFNSFPSGHASVAFVGATVLFHEFKQSNKWIAYSGFAMASSVALFRMLNQRHWFSDVVAGAGIAILSTNLIYYFEPLKNWNPFSFGKSNGLALMPSYSHEAYGLMFSARF
ncbi:MAG: phosphatase PAP2 family protein [Bacteroidales bacterium]